MIFFKGRNQLNQPVEHISHYEPPKSVCKQLDLLLSTTAKGSNLLKEYTMKGILSVLQRKHLVECIVETYSNCGLRIPTKEIQFYADEIIRLFPTELKVIIQHFGLLVKVQLCT